MWSNVVLFVLTFAVLGLLLGFAAVYDTNQLGQLENGIIQQNVTSNETQSSSQSSSAVVEQEIDQ
jgi:hypothetical protein